MIGIERNLQMKISVDNQKIMVDSKKFNAVFDGATLTSLKSMDGVEFLHRENLDVRLDVVFADYST
ncbi:MAG: hypothetical protein QG588_2019, partial [Candidatus Poribacteria bacterium]|nr:hypothetical protein [Candidatus Poribacteria bacterium]